MDHDDELFYRRQGFWLRMARERAGKSQAGAAVEIGLKASTKSTISDYETGQQVAPQPALRQLARWYGVPVALFTNPPMTADEVIERVLLDEASQLGEGAERRDWEPAVRPDPGADGEPGAAPGRLSA